MSVMFPIGPTLLAIVDNSFRMVFQDWASFRILNCWKENVFSVCDYRQQLSYDLLRLG